jgi:hypothetical protein
VALHVDLEEIDRAKPWTAISREIVVLRTLWVMSSPLPCSSSTHGSFDPSSKVEKPEFQGGWCNTSSWSASRETARLKHDAVVSSRLMWRATLSTRHSKVDGLASKACLVRGLYVRAAHFE